eukprot:scaffold11373_cov150-Isochrysis_galbana.AAC.1
MPAPPPAPAGAPGVPAQPLVGRSHEVKGLGQALFGFSAHSSRNGRPPWVCSFFFWRCLVGHARATPQLGWAVSDTLPLLSAVRASPSSLSVRPSPGIAFVPHATPSA